MGRTLRKLRHFLAGWISELYPWEKCLYCIILCVSAIALWNAYKIPASCAICDFPSSHPPCIVNLTSGKVAVLYVYDHPYNRFDEICEYQPGGFLAFYYGAGLKMMRSAGQNVTTTFSNKDTRMYPSHFCLSCRRQLREYKRDNYVLADLFIKGAPVFYPIADGMEFDLRCYTITITADQAHTVTVQGNLY